ncbi:MAG: hypothetical protein WC758_00105 [Candidatus Woesearchaeota archaeon]|jgi:RecJ-like exonuclease
MKKDLELNLVLESAGLKKETNKNINKENNRESNMKNNEEQIKENNEENIERNSRSDTRTNRPERSGRSDRFDRSEKIFVRSEKKSSLALVKDGDYFDGIVKITRKARPGPVIFSVTDGEMTVDAVTKDSEFDVDAVVKLAGPVSERAGRLQIEIKSILKADANFDLILEEKSIPKRTEFSIESDRYEKMKPRFLEIAKRIRTAVFSNQPILIRHHNDSDGINSGLAIEQACKGLMNKVGVNPDYNLFRSPSKAPFYEVSDVFRDIVSAKRLVDGHDQKSPLILVLDNGSTPEDAFAFKTLKTLGYEAIVIDHHNPVIMKDGKTSVCPYLSYHLNPYMFGLDSQTSAGMLCYEMARFIDEDYENKLAPAIAAISDRCNIVETERYIINSCETKEVLTRIGVAIDFVAYQMKFDGGKGVFEELYTNTEMVDLINSKVKEGADTQLMSALPYLRTQEINGVIFSHIDLEKYTLRFTYPTPGKVIGMIHDKVAEGKDSFPVLSIGYVSDMIIIRATKPVLPVQKIIATLQKELPEANVDGGGHECAGTIKFVPAHLTTIIEKIKTMLKELKVE